MCETLTLAPGEREIPLRYANQIKLAQRHARHERDRIAALPLVHQRLGRVGICARTHARSTLYNLRLFGVAVINMWGFGMAYSYPGSADTTGGPSESCAAPSDRTL